MNGQHTNTAHGVLSYLISRAVLEGKTGESILKIPLTDFMNEFEGVQFTDDAVDIVLEVKITTSWNDGHEADLETKLDDPEEDDNVL